LDKGHAYGRKTVTSDSTIITAALPTTRRSSPARSVEPGCGGISEATTGSAL